MPVPVALEQLRGIILFLEVEELGELGVASRDLMGSGIAVVGEITPVLG